MPSTKKYQTTPRTLAQWATRCATRAAPDQEAVPIHHSQLHRTLISRLRRWRRPPRRSRTSRWRRRRRRPGRSGSTWGGTRTAPVFRRTGRRRTATAAGGLGRVDVRIRRMLRRQRRCREWRWWRISPWLREASYEGSPWRIRGPSRVKFRNLERGFRGEDWKIGIGWWGDWNRNEP